VCTRVFPRTDSQRAVQGLLSSRFHSCCCLSARYSSQTSILFVVLTVHGSFLVRCPLRSTNRRYLWVRCRFTLPPLFGLQLSYCSLYASKPTLTNHFLHFLSYRSLHNISQGERGVSLCCIRFVSSVVLYLSPWLPKTCVFLRNLLFYALF